MLENDEIIPVLKKQISKRFSFSCEIYTPPDKTGYTIRRFYRMYLLLRSLKCPILMADIDLVCSRDISTLFEKLQDSDVGILVREHEPVINQQVLASLFYCKPTDNGIATTKVLPRFVLADLHGTGVRWSTKISSLDPGTSLRVSAGLISFWLLVQFALRFYFTCRSTTMQSSGEQPGTLWRAKSAYSCTV